MVQTVKYEIYYIEDDYVVIIYLNKENNWVQSQKINIEAPDAEGLRVGKQVYQQKIAVSSVDPADRFIGNICFMPATAMYGYIVTDSAHCPAMTIDQMYDS